MSEESIFTGDTSSTELFTGSMGVKEIYVGNELIYQRPGGYFYLTLNTTENENGGE